MVDCAEAERMGRIQDHPRLPVPDRGAELRLDPIERDLEVKRRFVPVGVLPKLYEAIQADGE
ncbi:hypothetical protein [Aureimonas sp. SK2]|uniref:hypothetical protein n=1 Tax=Aureimonas sp. SK2 TaxID=3015992 RepID=UPI00244473E2|nr:hypothetical protein [Aureimonas sp. SK2]